MGDDDDFIKDEFEWALQDPTEEKLRSLGEVVSTITKKLVEAITDLQTQVYEVQKQMQTLDSRIDTLQSRMASSSGPSAASSAGASAPVAGASVASAPKPPPPRAPASPTTMMGELKQLLAARRQKAQEE